MLIYGRQRGMFMVHRHLISPTRHGSTTPGTTNSEMLYFRGGGGNEGTQLQCGDVYWSRQLMVFRRSKSLLFSFSACVSVVTKILYLLPYHGLEKTCMNSHMPNLWFLHLALKKLSELQKNMTNQPRSPVRWDVRQPDGLARHGLLTNHPYACFFFTQHSNVAIDRP